MSDFLAPIRVPAKKSKQEYLGKKIFKRIVERNINQGGSFTEVTGAPGEGKTSTMLSIAKNIINHYPDEKVFWASSYGSPLQFFPFKNYNILIKEGMDIKFWDRIKKEETKFPNTVFSTFEQLYDYSKPGTLNCVFFGDRRIWMDFIEFLLSKNGWHTVMLDEISEICPSFTGGNTFKKIGYFANHVVGQSRRCGITIVCNTQSTTDTDHRLRKKLNIRIFLPGSKIDKYTRVMQKAVDNLRVDHKNGSQAYICMGGQFGVIRSQDIYCPLPDVSIEARTSFKDSEIYGFEKTRKNANKDDTGRCRPKPNRIDKLDELKDYKYSIPV